MTFLLRDINKNMLHGWLVLDKPPGLTSAAAVAQVKRLLRPVKIGHAGTLDPLASGILPLALGEATKTVAFMMETSKAYDFTVTWGEQRDTDDAEGKVIATSSKCPEMSQIVPNVPLFVGRIMQVPPIYAAVKIDGKRAYALARAGEEVVLAPREVFVESLEITEYNNGSTRFFMRCGKGTYVRAIARDMAKSLGTVGYVSHLRRTQVGRFTEAHAISLEKLGEIVHKNGLASMMQLLQPVESALDDIPARNVSSTLATRLRQGQAISIDADSGHLLVKSDGELIAICRAEQGMVKPLRVFNL